MPIPSIEDLKSPTLQCLRDGLTDTGEMRQRLARDFGLGEDALDRRLNSPVPIFTNNHAWALVRLQQEGLISKTGERTYGLTDRRKERRRDPENYRVEPPELGNMPSWAKTWISRANRHNGPSGPRFTEHDLMELWRECDGRCAVTGLEYSEEKIGSGRAKRAFAGTVSV